MLRHLAAALVVFASPLARADVDRCSDTAVDLAWTGTDFAEIGGDTGWFPSWSPAQLRLSGRVVGETAVASGVNAKACWGNGMTAIVAPRAQSGLLDIAYGAELHAYAKIDTSVLGNAIYWEGELPIPYIPKDLLVGGTRTFDPLLDGRVEGSVSDATAPITLLSTDLIGNLIGIIGISGGLRIAVTPSMVTSYRSGSLQLGTATGLGNQTLSLPTPSGGFGAALDLPMAIDGVVTYEPTLTFDVRFDIKILGVRVVDWQLFAVPMTLPSLDRRVSLEAQGPAHFTLPAIDGIGEGARLDFSASTTQELVIRNTGERALVIQPSVVPVGVTVEPMTIAPGKDGHFRVTVADPTALGANAQTLALITNDPDMPELDVAVGVDIGGTDPGAVEDPAAGGCSTGGSSSGILLALGIVLALRRRRVMYSKG